MPVMDGIQAASEVRQRETDGNLPHIPIIAVTGNARMEQIENGQSPDSFLTVALSVGMDHVVTKPYSKKDLIDKIRELTQVIQGTLISDLGEGPSVITD